MQEQVEALGGSIGKQVVLGVRPEAMATANVGRFAGHDNTIPVQIDVVEPLGDKMDVFVRTPTHEHICCRVDAHARIEEGQKLPMHMDMRRVHFFEPGETGMNVSLNGATVRA